MPGRYGYRRRGYSTRRAIDKVTVNQFSTITTTQNNNALYTATTACTFVGARITGSFNALSTTAKCAWALVVNRNGIAPSQISLTDGATFYSPEQDILASGMLALGGIPTSSIVIPVDLVVKTKRKLLTGDQISFCTYSDTASGGNIAVIDTVFIKQ